MIGSLKPTTKLALVDSLRRVKILEEKIEQSTGGKRRTSLLNQREREIDTVKKISKYLNSQGKLSEREQIQLLSLDFLKPKRFGKGFTL